ncbi:MAG TPA: DNA-formamidopyrimidine glycosylase [Stenomitos sp.]
MPELPEVETVRRGLDRLTCDRRITDVEVLLNRTIAYPHSIAEFQQGLTGVYIQTWTRRGKYLLAPLLASLSGSGAIAAGWLGVHLRMTGQMLWLETQDALHKHTRVRLKFEGDHELRFIDQRTFGQMWWIPPTQDPQTVMAGMGALGPEPLASDFSEDYLAGVCKKRDRPIKSVLLDQTLIAGLGNIYADESLFLSGLHPEQPSRSVKPAQVQRLHSAIRSVLQTALEQGGTTFSDFRHVSGINGNYGGVALVYRRTGEPCRQCGSAIAKLKLGGRSCHYCPACQPPILSSKKR